GYLPERFPIAVGETGIARNIEPPAARSGLEPGFGNTIRAGEEVILHIRIDLVQHRDGIEAEPALVVSCATWYVIVTKHEPVTVWRVKRLTCAHCSVMMIAI